MSRSNGKPPSIIERVCTTKPLIIGMVEGYTITIVCEASVNEYSLKGLHLPVARVLKDGKPCDKWLSLIVKLDDKKHVIDNLILRMHAPFMVLS